MKKKTIAAVICVLGATACAGSSSPPAQDPSSAAAEHPAPSPAPEMNASTAPTPTTPPAGATSMMGSGHDTDSTTSPATIPTTTPSATPAPGANTTPAPANDMRTRTVDGSAGAQNTRTNARDRNGTLTPIHQGNSKAEIAITATIRKGVMHDSTLSFTAKNVKIITVGTTVTLRGPVRSDAERSTIENLARQTDGVTDVDDQLEVKP